MNKRISKSTHFLLDVFLNMINGCPSRPIIILSKIEDNSILFKYKCFFDFLAINNSIDINESFLFIIFEMKCFIFHLNIKTAYIFTECFFIQSFIKWFIWMRIDAFQIRVPIFCFIFNLKAYPIE